MQVLMLQHGDLFVNRSGAALTFLVKVSLLIKSFVILLFVMSPEIPDDLIFGRVPSFSWREFVSTCL